MPGRRQRGQQLGFIVVTALSVSGPTPRALADFIWTGLGADDLWTTGGNWQGGSAPPTDVGMGLTFGPTGGDETADAGAIDWTGITFLNFTGADGSFAIVGSGSLTFEDAADITNDSTFDQTINVDLIATGDTFTIDAEAGNLFLGGALDIDHSGGVALTVQGDFDTTIDGVITGAGSLIKTGSGTLTLGGLSTFSGGGELHEGTVVIARGRALGSGEFDVLGDVEFRPDGDTHALINRFDIDGGSTLTFAGAGELRLNASLVGDGDVVVNMDTPDDTIRLQTRNGFDGLTIEQGIVAIGNADALGTGGVRVTGLGAIDALNESMTLNDDFRINTNGRLSFIGKRGVNISGRILGPGELHINFNRDDDVIALLRDNARTGITTLERGIIRLGHDEALGEGDLVLAGDGTLQSTSFARILRNDINLNDNDLTFSGGSAARLTRFISGTGRVIIDEGFILTLTRDHTYTGQTQVREGLLALRANASIAGNLLLRSSGVFRGEGSIGGDVTVKSNGLIAPGDELGFDVGTVRIGGDYTQERDGRVQIQIDADKGEADRLRISGSARLRNHSTILAQVQGTGYIRSGRVFTVIKADGGVIDNGVEIESASATITLEVVRDPDFTDGNTKFGLQLFRAADAYSAAALPGNANTIGQVLDSHIALADADPTGETAALLGRVDALSAEQYNLALTQLSPQSYSSLTTAGVGQLTNFHSQQAAYLAARRAGVEADWSPWRTTPPPGAMAWASDENIVLAQAIAASIQDDDGQTPPPLQESLPEEKRWGSYVKLQAVWGDQDPGFNISGFRSTSLGFQMGLDYRFAQNFTAGLAAGYVNTSVDIANNGGDMQEHSVRFGPYASFSQGNWYLDASLTGGYHFYTNDRNISTLNLVAESNFNGWDVTGYLGGGYHYDLAKNWLMTPSAAVQYSYFSFDGFTESGAPSANLTVDSRDSDSLKSRLGVNFTYVGLDWGAKVLPSAYLGWEHEFFNDTDITGNFITGGNPFIIDSGTRDKDAFFYGVQLAVLLERNVSAFFRFEDARGSTSDVRAVAAGLTINF